MSDFTEIKIKRESHGQTFFFTLDIFNKKHKSKTETTFKVETQCHTMK